MELKKYKLGDIAEILISSIDKKSKEGESPVRLCNFVDVYHNWAITADMVSNFMEATTSEKNIDRFSLKKGYVAFTKDSETRDDIGVPTYIAEDLDNTVLGYHCALVKPDENIILGKYLNAFLHSDYIKRYFELNATGSGMRYTLSVDTLYNIPILAPSLDIQKRIGELFSNIDRKICINRSLNHYLEEMLNLITSRFIFSAESLEKKKIGEIAEVKAGGDCPNIFSKIKTNDCQVPIYSNGIEKRGLYGFTNKSVINRRCVTVAARGTIGHCERRLYPFVPIIRLLSLIPIDEGGDVYLHQVISGMTFKKNGSVQQQLTVPEISCMEIPYPNKETLKLYNDITSPIIHSIEQNISDLEVITSLRDELLSLLMNGQVSIKQLNNDLPLFRPILYMFFIHKILYL